MQPDQLRFARTPCRPGALDPKATFAAGDSCRPAPVAGAQCRAPSWRSVSRGCPGALREASLGSSDCEWRGKGARRSESPDPLHSAGMPMDIQVKLFATLKKYLPPEAKGRQVGLTVPEGATVIEVLDQLGVPRGLAKLIVIDGVVHQKPDMMLRAGNVLSVFPAIAGG